MPKNKEMQSNPEVANLLSEFQIYSEARLSFLRTLQRGTSCRDPLAEFSEVLVAKLLHGTFPSSRTQKGYDLILKHDGGEEKERHVQVKYLANPPGQWINWHTIDFKWECDAYALVLFENMKLLSVLVFSKDTLKEVCRKLGKRHPNQDRTLQFTKRNYEMIIKDKFEFEGIGVKVFIF